MPATRAAVVLLAAGLALAACGRCGAPVSNAAGVDIVFTGPESGTLTSARTECDINQKTQYNVAITGALGGKNLDFNLQVNSSYTGPGEYPAGSILGTGSNLRLQIGDYTGSTTPGAGTMTIAKDEKSGSVDAELGGGEHAKGTWSCAEVKRNE
jgi:hypothetical protein